MQIQHRYTNAVLFSAEASTTKDLLLQAVSAKTNLWGAYLQGAYLRGAYLQGAYLQGANLRGADLQGANLRGVNLWGVNLQGANLRGANLQGANLRGADLQGADLRGADLQGAKIDGEEITAEPITLNGLRWWVLITESFMRIGCQRHSHAAWREGLGDFIKAMDPDAASFWEAHREVLLALCAIQAAKKEN